MGHLHHAVKELSVRRDRLAVVPLVGYENCCTLSTHKYTHTHTNIHTRTDVTVTDGIGPAVGFGRLQKGIKRVTETQSPSRNPQPSG